MQELGISRPDGPAPLGYEAVASTQLLLGGRRLREEFRTFPVCHAGRHAAVFECGQADPPVILLRSGFAFRASILPDGRRAILDLLIAGDITGVDHLMLTHSVEALIAANRIEYVPMPAARARELMGDETVAMRLITVLAEARWRSDRLAASIGRLDAEGRICVMLLDLHDRMRQRGLIDEPRFNLPLTQEKMADHLGLTLVHVNRVLRRLREERILTVDRQAVVIEKLDRLRQLARGLPEPAILSEAYLPAALALGLPSNGASG